MVNYDAYHSIMVIVQIPSINLALISIWFAKSNNIILLASNVLLVVIINSTYNYIHRS